MKWFKTVFKIFKDDFHFMLKQKLNRMSLNESDIKDQETFIEVLNYDQTDFQAIDQKRRILSALANDKVKKNRSEIFNKKYIAGMLRTLRMKTDKLMFIDEEIILTQFMIFLDSVTFHSHHLGDTLKSEEEILTILIEGIIHRIDQQRRNMDNLMNSYIHNKLLALSRRKKRKVSAMKKQLKNKILDENNEGKKKDKLILKKISSNHESQPKIIFQDYLDFREYQCLTNVTTVKIPRIAINKMESSLERAQKQSIGKYLCKSLGLFEPTRANKLVLKVQKRYYKEKEKININSSQIYIIYEGSLLLVLENVLKINLEKGCIVNPQLATSKKYQTAEIQSSHPCVVFSIGKNYIKQIYQFQPDCMTQIKANLSKITKERNQRLTHLCKGQNVNEQEEVYELNTSNFNSIVGLSKNYSNRFRVDREGKKIISDWKEGQFLSNYPYTKLMQSYDKVENVMKQYKDGGKEMKKQGSLGCEEKVRSEKNRCVGKNNPKKIYYNEKVRKMKIKNIASKVIPNIEKKDFKTELMEKKIFENSLFTTFFEYPVAGEKENEQKKNKVEKKSIYCLSILKRNSKQVDDYNFDYNNPLLFRRKPQQSTNISAYEVHRERKMRVTTFQTVKDHSKEPQVKKKKMREKGSAKAKLKSPPKIEERRIRTAGNDE